MKINQSIKRRSRHSSGGGGRVPPSGRLLTSPQPDGPHYWGMAFPLDMALLQTTHKLPAVGSGSAEFSTPSMAGNLELASGMVSDAILLCFFCFLLAVCVHVTFTQRGRELNLFATSYKRTKGGRGPKHTSVKLGDILKMRSNRGSRALEYLRAAGFSQMHGGLLSFIREFFT